MYFYGLEAAAVAGTRGPEWLDFGVLSMLVLEFGKKVEEEQTQCRPPA
ncbi:hypothetical protein GGD67_002873 [Bradyrhizobium sp. IAR9]|nr:hypothetical protein [Bradyrhizobium sp. IAR9]